MSDEYEQMFQAEETYAALADAMVAAGVHPSQGALAELAMLRELSRTLLVGLHHAEVDSWLASYLTARWRSPQCSALGEDEEAGPIWFIDSLMEAREWTSNEAWHVTLLSIEETASRRSDTCLRARIPLELDDCAQAAPLTSRARSARTTCTEKERDAFHDTSP